MINKKDKRFFCLAVVLISTVLYASIPSFVFADESETPDSSASIVSRVAGDTRYDTMRQISACGFSHCDSVVIACGNNYPDALSASSLAGMLHAPVLLTDPHVLSQQVESEINRLGASHAFILGGERAVSGVVEERLATLGLSTKRFSGSTRYETAALIANYVADQTDCGTFIIANGNRPWDALSIGGFSYAKNAPVLLANDNGSISSDASYFLSSRASSIDRIVIVGGTAAVSGSTEKMLSSRFPVDRWAGSTRYETSTAIATKIYDENLKLNDLVVASGENYPDALAGSALAGTLHSAVLLSPKTDSAALSGYIQLVKPSISRCFLLGGSSALDSGIERQLSGWLSEPCSSVKPEIESSDLLVFAPHQDDELLSMGSFIEDASKTGTTVHAVLCTDGSRSSILKSLTDRRLCPLHFGSHNIYLTTSAFDAARDAEYENSCRALSASTEIYSLSSGRVHDGNLSVQSAKSIIEDCLSRYPGAAVCTLNPFSGKAQHVDHRNLGLAAIELYKEGKIKDLRLFVEPYLLQQDHKDTRGVSLNRTYAVGDNDLACMDSAFHAYDCWDPQSGQFAIGYHSVRSAFDSLRASSYSCWWCKYS